MDEISAHRQDAGPMEFTNSQPVPENLYQTPRYLSTIRPRINKAAKSSDDAIWEVRDALTQAGLTNLETGWISPISENVAALIFAESLPERLPVIAAFIELALVYDGKSPLPGDCCHLSTFHY